MAQRKARVDQPRPAGADTPATPFNLDAIPDRIIRPKHLEAIDGLSLRTRYELEAAGQYPSRRQIGPSAVGYLLSDVLGWMRSRPKASPQAAAELAAKVKGGAAL